MPETPFDPDIDYPHLARKQAERIAELEAENRRMRELLGHAVQIIAVHVPKDALGYSSIGYPDEEPYPLRDEFLANMRAALSQEEKP